MKKPYAAHMDDSGFTLLEIIITLIISSILGAIMVQTMGTSLYKSAQPVAMVQDANYLHQAFERMNSEYKRILLTDSDPLETLKISIGNEGTDQNNSYGTYTILINRYIKFISNNEVNENTLKTILKTSIKYGNQTITGLFTR